jgi:hypothetical protein
MGWMGGWADGWILLRRQTLCERERLRSVQVGGWLGTYPKFQTSYQQRLISIADRMRDYGSVEFK